MRIAASLVSVAGTGAGENPPVLGDAPPPLGGGAAPDEDLSAAPGKGSAGDVAPGEGATSVRKSLLMRSRVWLTNPCTCESADTPLAFPWLAEILAVKSRTPV